MSLRRALATLALSSIVCLAVSSPARAQDAISKDGAAAVKASFVADLETLRGKFVGLAEAFPQDSYYLEAVAGARSGADAGAWGSFLPTLRWRGGSVGGVAPLSVGVSSLRASLRRGPEGAASSRAVWAVGPDSSDRGTCGSG